MICVASVRHKKVCVSKMRLSATQRAPRRVDKAANAPKFMSTQNENTRLSAALVMRKLMPAKDLWSRFRQFAFPVGERSDRSIDRLAEPSDIQVRVFELSDATRP